MKIKRLPTDFQVEEIIRFDLSQKGDFAVYEVHKENISTSSLINYLSKWMKKSPRLFSHAGIKDKYGQTSQHISLKGDGPEQIATESFSAKRIGYSLEAIKSKHLVGNNFRIVVRNLSELELTNFEQNISQIAQNGFLNYFDDQRFRSQRSAKNVFGFFIYKKEYEKALKVFVDEVLINNKKISLELCEQILQNWGNWESILERKLPNDLFRVFEHLKKQPNDFQGAVYKLDYFDFRMMISASQSYLWNEILSEYLTELLCDDLVTVKGAWQTYYFYKNLSQNILAILSELSIEMPNSNWHSSISEIKNILHKILTRHKLQLTDIKLSGLKKIFVENHTRKVLEIPKKFQFKKPEEDELYPKNFKIELSFELPPGSYATMLLKQLFVHN